MTHTKPLPRQPPVTPPNATPSIVKDHAVPKHRKLATQTLLLLMPLILPTPAYPQEKIALTGYATIDNSYYVFLKDPVSGNPVMLSETPDPLKNKLLSFDGHKGSIQLGGKTLPIQNAPTHPEELNPPPMPPCDCDYCHDPSEDPAPNLNFLEDLIKTKKKTFEEKSRQLQAQPQSQYSLQAILPKENPDLTQTSDPDFHEKFPLAWHTHAQIQLLDKTSGKTLTLEDNGHWTDITQKQLPPENPEGLRIEHRLMLPSLPENKLLLKKGNQTLIVEP